LDKACREVGFLIITGHNIPQATIDAAWEVSRRFFDLPTAAKTSVPMTDDYPYGYIGFGEELLQKGLEANNGDERSENLRKIGTAPDLKESLQVCPGPETNPSPQMKAPQWHSEPADLKEKWTAYYRQLEILSANLLRVMALALKLPEEFFEDKINQHMSVLRALYVLDVSRPDVSRPSPPLYPI
jgi:isopenicillin N synthase-like dioxygenase